MMLNGKARKTGYCWQDEINRKTKAEGVDIANDEILVKRNRLDSIGEMISDKAEWKKRGQARPRLLRGEATALGWPVTRRIL